MEGLIRLSEAHAKIRLSEDVEKQDFEVAKRIFMYCLKQVGIDNETGMIDISRTTQKIPISKIGKVEKLFDILRELSEKLGKEIPYSEILEEGEKVNFKKWEVNDYLDELRKENKIFEPRRGVISVVP